jgi:hypothetical protein
MRKITPKISSVHVFFGYALPVYKFICGMQHEEYAMFA